jgi:hypothetical protein
VLAVLLLAGGIDPTRDWLIVLSVVTGLAMVAPRFCVDLFGFDRGDRDDDRAWRWQRRMGRWSERADRDWAKWERRMDRRRMRRTDGWGDDWS